MKSRFLRRADGVWVWREAVVDYAKPGYPKRRPPLEWDRVSLQKCIERYEDLYARHKVDTDEKKKLVEIRKAMGKWIDGVKITPKRAAELDAWANWSLYTDPMKLVAEEYWARVCNAIILGGE